MNLNIKSNSLKLFALRFFIVSITSFTIAFLSEKITLVVPTIALSLMIANSIETGSTTNRNRIDEDSSNMDDTESGLGGNDGTTDGSDGGVS